MALHYFLFFLCSVQVGRGRRVFSLLPAVVLLFSPTSPLPTAHEPSCSRQSVSKSRAARFFSWLLPICLKPLSKIPNTFFLQTFVSDLLFPFFARPLRNFCKVPLFIFLLCDGPVSEPLGTFISRRVKIAAPLVFLGQCSRRLFFAIPFDSSLLLFLNQLDAPSFAGVSTFHPFSHLSD